MAGLMACALLAATLPAGAESPAQPLSEVLGWLATARIESGRVLAAAYERAPALVMVLAALFVIPVTALLGLLAHSIGLRLRLFRGRTPGLRARAAPAAGSTPATAAAARAPVTPWPTSAWLSIDGSPPARLPSQAQLVRIGRHDENDIRLPHASVHRHHAIIHRTSDTEFVITDLSGRDGNGVLVNGERLSQSRLLDGDVIALGEVSIRFASRPV